MIEIGLINIVKFINENKDKIGIKFSDSITIDPYVKLDLMSKVMKSVDSSISVTYLSVCHYLHRLLFLVLNYRVDSLPFLTKNI